ncbi:Snf7-domain-containing protein [Lipomyces oligophaga]|uniref:Snf7-domain-containing protein n=1 Tax=Lipomyces oligophaga TaxID=45792 RepID=UPI0034D00834
MTIQSHIFSLPDFTESRLASLYSDFSRLKDTNPDGFEANVRSWAAGLASSLRAGYQDNRLILHTGKPLLDELATVKFGRPLSLSAVYQEQVASKKFIPLAKFTEATTSIFANPQWRIVRYTSSAVSWAFRDTKIHYLYDTISTWTRQSEIDQEFVMLDNVERAAKVLLDRVKLDPMNSGVYTFEMVRHLYSRNPFKEASDTYLTNSDFEVLFRYLARDVGQAKISGTVIKFRTHTELAEITDEEISIAQLKSSMRILEDRIQQHEQSETSSRTKLSEILNRPQQTQHNKKLGLNELKKIKLAENGIQKLVAYRLQLETLLHSIESAKDNVDMVKIMETSATVLEKLNNSVDVERATEIGDKLSALIGDTDEISKVLGDTVVEDDEIEDEYNQILDQTRNSALPSMPGRKPAEPHESESRPNDELEELFAKINLNSVPNLDSRSSKEETAKANLIS